MSLLDKASLIISPTAYKSGTLYSVIPSDGSGDMTFSRASTGTRVNSQGLVEVVPYNLMLSTEDFTSNWVASGCSVTANTTTAPNGTLTADTITDSSTFGYVYLTSASVDTSQIVTHSVFLKRINNDWVSVSIARGGATTYGEFGVWFNLATGAIGSNFQAGAGVLLDSLITDEGDGWYRCSIKGYVTNAVSYVPYVFNSNADNSFTSSSGKARYQWGAQLNEGSLKDYFPIGSTRNNFPRLDYSNGSCPSLLLEPQRTNSFEYSEQFDNAYWTKYESTITANDTTAPSGLTTADKLTDNTSNDGHFFYRVVTISTALNLSIYAKANQYTKVAIRNLSDGGDVIFDLSNGTIVSTPSNFTNAQIEDAGNGWYRISATTNGTSGTKAMGYSLVNNSNQTTFVGTGTSSAYFWGAQLEAGSYATSYIPTTSTSVTRVADSCSKTGISSLIGQTEGTIFVDIERFFQDSTFLLQIDDATANNRFILATSNGTQADYFVINGGTVQANASGGTLPNKGHIKVALSYKNNDFAFYANGQQINLDTSGSVPATSILRIGENSDGAGNKGAKYNSVILFKERLSNTELAQLTTI